MWVVPARLSDVSCGIASNAGASAATASARNVETARGSRAESIAKALGCEDYDD
jgi:hypothetical protein